MVRFTIVARAADALPLVATTEGSQQDEQAVLEFQRQAKGFLRRLTTTSSTNPLPTKATVRSEPFCFHYIIEVGVCFIVLCDKTYPRLLAFSFLMELQREFFETYTHSDVQSAARPYEFLKFDPFLEKTRKRYVNTRTLRTSHNLAELSERLQQLRVLNIGDVLGADYKANYNNGVHENGENGGIVAGGGSMKRLQAPWTMRLGIAFFAAVSALASIVAIFRDLLPAILDHPLAIPLTDLERTRHGENDTSQSGATVFVEWVALLSSLLGLLLVVQTIVILRSGLLLNRIVLATSFASFLVVFLRIGVWLFTGLPTGHTFVNLIVSQCPYIALVLTTFVHFMQEAISGSKGGHHSD